MMILRVFNVPDELLLRIANRAAGQGVTSSDVVRSFIDEWLLLEQKPLRDDVNLTTARSFYLTRKQDKALTEFAEKSNSTVTKGMAFRAALIHGIGYHDITGSTPVMDKK